MNINGFELVNEEKLNRVIEGVVGRAGVASGGLGKDADPALILANYDRTGGLITRNGEKVQTGCFWDFKNSVPVAEPKVVLVYRINGKEVLVPDGEAEPLSVKAAKLAEQAEAEEKKPAKAKRNAKAK